MKNFWAWSATILFVLLLLLIGYSYDRHQAYEELVAINQQLEADVAEVKQSLAEAHLKNKELEKKSLEGMLNETNKVVISGWEALLNKVEKELSKAREMVEKKQKEFSQDPAEKLPPKDPSAVIDGERT